MWAGAGEVKPKRRPDGRRSLAFAIPGSELAGAAVVLGVLGILAGETA